MKRAVAVLALLSAPVLATAIRPFAGMRGDANLGGNTPNGSPTSAVPLPTFDLIAGTTTPNDLPDALTVNSTAMTLLLACDAQGISGTNWACRDANGSVTLSEASTGTSPTTTINTPFHALDTTERGVRYAVSGKTHAAASSTVADIGSQDFVIEAVWRHTTVGSAGTIFAKRSTAAGFSLQRTTTNFFSATVSDGTNTVTTGGLTMNAGTTSHVIIFADRNGGGNGLRPYFNGATQVTTNIDTVGSMSGSAVFTSGSTSGSTAAPGADPLISFRIWVCPAGTPNCFASSSNDSLARERASIALGMKPAVAVGSPTPTALTRATSANVDVVDGVVRHLYTMWTGVPRIARRTHSGGTAVSGFLSEPAVSNIALQSQNLATTWTAITTGDQVLPEAFAGADLSTTGDNVDGDNTAPSEHGFRQAITLTAAPHTFSAWAKTGTQNFVALRNATIANGVAWFDVATCTSSSCVVGENCTSAVGTTQAGISRASAERYPIDTTGDGVADVNLCRVSITYTGTAASHNHDLLCAPSDGNLTYTDSDVAADCGFWGVRVEAFPVATSYLATTTAATARNADDVRFDGASHYTGSPSTMDTAVLCPSFDTGVQSTFASVGTGAANYARLGVDATADRGQGSADVAGVQWLITAASGDISDGVAHTLRQTMATNNIQAYVDGVSIGTDALATLPTVASSFVYLGTAGSTASQSACLISRARLWSSSVAP